jgi:acyl-coenzyme A thioesterase PaaI-like protein
MIGTLVIIALLFAPIVYFYLLPIFKIAAKNPRPMVIWDACKTQVPLGSSFIGDLLMMLVLFVSSPYSANIFPVVQSMDLHKVVISAREFFLLRNPFKSMHVAALTNLAELTCALNVMNQIHGKGIAIPTGVTIKFLKKSRGKMTATCDCEIPSRYDAPVDEKTQKRRIAFTAPALIKDSNGDTCVTVDIEFMLQFNDESK